MSLTRSWLVVALAGACAVPGLHAQCPDGAPPPCSRAAHAAPVPHGSVAVLPFSNRSADSSDAFLAEELPEQISGRLSRIAQLHVTSATAVEAQWRRTPDALAAARALRVEWLVTGSLRRVGQQVSANIELVRTATGEQAWAAPFRRGDGDLAAIESAVAESVAVAVGGRLAPAQVAVLQRQPTRNPEAYRHYLYARSLIVRRNAADIARAIVALDSAIRLDPDFAGAWARLSMAFSLQTQYGGPSGVRADSLMALSRTAALRALALDSNIAESWLAQSQWYTLHGEPGESWRSLSRAVRLDSLDADIEHAIGYLYSCDILVIPEEAERHFRRALELNPDLRNSWRHLGMTYWVRDQLAEAEAYVDSALARGTWNFGLSERAIIRYGRGNVAGALADQSLAESMGPIPDSWTSPMPIPVRQVLYALARGDSSAALAALNDQSDSWQSDFRRAVVSMAFGRREVALAALERMKALPDQAEPLCAPATPCSASLRTWRTIHLPIFAPLKDDARFLRLLAETRPKVPWLPGWTH